MGLVRDENGEPVMQERWRNGQPRYDYIWEPPEPGTAARDARIITLQARLLDHTGHVRPALTPQHAAELLGEINELRAANGWRPLDMHGRG